PRRALHTKGRRTRRGPRRPAPPGGNCPMSCRSRYRAALRVERLEDRTAPAAAAVLEAPVLPVIDAPMKAHLREVFLRGQALGRRADAFAKVGDSHTYWNHNLAELGSPFYTPAAPGALAEYPELVGVAA